MKKQQQQSVWVSVFPMEIWNASMGKNIKNINIFIFPQVLKIICKEFIHNTAFKLKQQSFRLNKILKNT